jgi:hypothetical protein
MILKFLEQIKGRGEDERRSEAVESLGRKLPLFWHCSGRNRLSPLEAGRMYEKTVLETEVSIRRKEIPLQSCVSG